MLLYFNTACHKGGICKISNECVFGMGMIDGGGGG